MPWLQNFNSVIGGCWRFLTEVLKDLFVLDVLDHHYMWYFTCVPNFNSLSWLEVCQEPHVLEVILGGYWWFLTGVLEDGVILNIMDHHHHVIIYLCAKFHLSSMIESASSTPCPQILSWWILEFPDLGLDDEGILNIRNHNFMRLFACVTNLSSLAGSEVFQELPIPWSHTWRTLMVPDWSLGGCGHLWLSKSSWQTMMKLS